MNKENIKKLLISNNWDDFLIGLNLIKDWSWEEVKQLADRYDEFQGGISLNISLFERREDNCFQLKNCFCHRNHRLFMYEGQSTYRSLDYIKI